jgi:hypothetical protein
VPVEEIEASDRIAEEVDPSDVRPRPVGHDGDVAHPVEVVVDVDSQIPQVGHRGDIAGA